MTVKFIDGFDHYGKLDIAKEFNKPGDSEPTEAQFFGPEGLEFSIRIERVENGWHLKVKGEGVLIFAERPRFMVQPA